MSNEARLAGVSLMFIAAVLVAGVCRDRRDPGPPPAREVTLTVHYSRFEPDVITVPAGVEVPITIQNDDPIAHEWIVGGDEVHARHRTGSEPYHDSIPTEVTVFALTSSTTRVKFDEPGDYKFICHLPGHEAYGMVGTLRVVEDSEAAAAASR